MKRIAICLLLMLMLGGCGGVLMNAEYSQLLDKTCMLSAETARRAAEGNLTQPQMVEALKAQADTWQRFADARDGVGGD